MDPNVQPRKYSDKRPFTKYPNGQNGGGKGQEGQRTWLHDKFEGNTRGGYVNKVESSYPPRQYFYEGNYTGNGHGQGVSHTNGTGQGLGYGHTHGHRSNSKGSTIRIRVNNRVYEVDKNSDLNSERVFSGLKEFVSSLDIESELDRIALLIRLLNDLQAQGVKPLGRGSYEGLLSGFLKLSIGGQK